MDPLTASLIIGGIGAGGQMLGGMQSNSMNASEAHKQRMWQDAMSGSAHQRQVRDLKLAGLNPILGVGGNGASTPGGAMATSQNAMQGLGASAMEMAMMKTNLEKNAAEVGVLKSQKHKNYIEAKVAETGIPGSEAINSLWDTVKGKLFESKQSGPKSGEMIQGDTREDAAAILRHKREMKNRQLKQRSIDRESESVFLP